MVSEVFNMDCLTYMQGLPDKFFELAIVDPEYGIGISNNPVRQKHKKKDWDKKIPSAEYFNELKRVCVNQIIWGGNYFIDYLSNTQGFIIWDKKQPQDFSLAMCEFAYTSIQSPAKMFRLSVLSEKGKIHPTQKPVALYKWLLQNYAKKGDKVFDSHMGSQSSRLAAWDMGFDYYGCELDAEYFEQGNKRFEDFKKQQSLFTPEQAEVKTGLGYDLFASDNLKLNKHLK